MRGGTKVMQKHIDHSNYHKVGGVIMRYGKEKVSQMKIANGKPHIIMIYGNYFVGMFKKRENMLKEKFPEMNLSVLWKEDSIPEELMLEMTIASRPKFQRIPTMPKGDLSPFDNQALTIKDYLEGNQEAKLLIEK